MNEVTVSIAKELLARKVVITHQTGRRAYEKVVSAYREDGIEPAEGPPLAVVPYIEEMPDVLARTDLVLCRAGAMTVGELAASGTAAILVPFAKATGDHQLKNALAHRDAGAGEVIQEEDLAAKPLLGLIEAMRNDPARLEATERAARARAVPGAAEAIVSKVEELIA